MLRNGVVWSVIEGFVTVEEQITWENLIPFVSLPSLPSLPLFD